MNKKLNTFNYKPIISHNSSHHCNSCALTRLPECGIPLIMKKFSTLVSFLNF